MSLLILSFIAGVLTVLAPCTLPLLPIIIGGSLREGGAQGKWKPVVITVSLALSLVLFTLLLKASTFFIDVPQNFWQFFSGILVTVIGLITVFPTIWETVSLKLRLSQKSNQALAQSAQKKNYLGDILIGASLGPVFASCSPTYFLILATVLPESFGTGLVYLMVYAFGLSLILFLVAFLGQKFVKKIQWAADPKGWFKRGLGILFILVGVLIMTGMDKKLQTYILDKGFFDVTQIEGKLLETLEQ